MSTPRLTTLPQMSESTSPEAVLSERRDPGIALITLNRPERLNAWNGDLAAQYFGHLDAAAADPAVKVIVVTGAGRGFCAGADMDALQAIGGGGAGGADNAAGGRPQYHTTTVPKPGAQFTGASDRYTNRCESMISRCSLRDSSCHGRPSGVARLP